MENDGAKEDGEEVEERKSDCSYFSDDYSHSDDDYNSSDNDYSSSDNHPCNLELAEEELHRNLLHPPGQIQNLKSHPLQLPRFGSSPSPLIPSSPSPIPSSSARHLRRVAIRIQTTRRGWREAGRGLWPQALCCHDGEPCMASRSVGSGIVGSGNVNLGLDPSKNSSSSSLPSSYSSTAGYNGSSNSQPFPNNQGSKTHASAANTYTNTYTNTHTHTKTKTKTNTISRPVMKFAELSQSLYIQIFLERQPKATPPSAYAIGSQNGRRGSPEIDGERWICLDLAPVGCEGAGAYFERLMMMRRRRVKKRGGIRSDKGERRRKEKRKRSGRSRR
uniref:Uncharacterized protein n=1 Tax=Polytomella parva TaxID=51329 RepID=A0A7S0V7M1_9CHLO|mmetsp:Transcript_26809/g.49262  ORF Transcript_26809/g.49262 Transcript_26809/m.49262 type:complete len:332 (+) Transcript_26809:170-1165(+)